MKCLKVWRYVKEQLHVGYVASNCCCRKVHNMWCSICVLSLFPTPVSFYLVSYISPESPSTSLRELGWTSPFKRASTREKVHEEEQQWEQGNWFFHLSFQKSTKKKKKPLGSSLKCQTYYTLVYEAGLWVEKVLDDLHLAQQTTPLCVWRIKKQKPTPERSLAGGLKPDCGRCVEQCHCNTKLKGKLFPTFLENMSFSLSLLSWMRKWTPLSCLYTQCYGQ